MASHNFSEVMDEVFASEGGYVDHPRDPGGATNMGITIHTARRLGLDLNDDGVVNKLDIRAMTRKHAEIVYRAEYWDRVRGDDLPSGVDLAVMDYGVNSGPPRAVMALQRIVGVPDDGVIGPVTLAAISNFDPKDLIARLCDERMAFLRRLSTWPVFGKGWRRRVEGVRAKALRMAKSTPRDFVQVPAGVPPVNTKENFDMWKRIIEGLVRHALGAGGAGLAVGGLDDATAIVGAIMTLVSFGWSVLDKQRTK